MLALRIEFLTGRYVATEYNDRQRAEWPPHPSRVYSALVAAWALPDEADAEERAALEWLAGQEPPALQAAGESRRDVVPHFVADNPVTALSGLDAELAKLGEAEAALAVAQEASATAVGSTKRAAKAREKADKEVHAARRAVNLALQPSTSPTTEDVKRMRAVMPASRSRQPRYFPSVTPEEPVAHLIWQGAPPVPIRRALDQLAARVVRIGHSSSLVSCRFVDEAPAPDWIPDERGGLVLRVPGPDQLAQLVEAHASHRETEPRTLPCRFQRYGAPKAEPEPLAGRSWFEDEWLVLRRVGGPRLPSTRIVDVAQAVRGALLRHAEAPPPEVLSGHAAEGGPSTRPHVAIVPLPFVGHRHADGVLLGVALVLPRERPEERVQVLRALGRWEEAHRKEGEETPAVPVRLGAAGVLELERVAWGRPPLATLDARVWCGPARVWLSVTPVALDRNPGDLYAQDPVTAEAAFRAAAETMAKACERVGLPLPVAVTVLPSVTWPGTLKARQYPPFPPEKEKLRRVQVHARITFAGPVQGPVLLGAGRYYGLGLFRPLPLDEEDDEDRDGSSPG